jgi:hypothetical protein
VTAVLIGGSPSVSSRTCPSMRRLSLRRAASFGLGADGSSLKALREGANLDRPQASRKSCTPVSASAG